MAEPKDAEIEQCLIRVARKAFKKDQEVTIKLIRSRVESKLGLTEGFLKSREWKVKSKEIVEAIVEESEDGETSINGGEGNKKDDRTKAQNFEKPQRSGPTVNGVKRKNDSSGEDDSVSDSSEESGVDSLEPKQKKSKTSPTAVSIHQQDSQSQAIPTQNSVIIPRKDFQPPSGYARLDPAYLSSNLALSEANLSGKEIWHITAPSHVPISSIASISREALQSQNPILNHNGIEYILDTQSVEASDSSHMVLLPTKDGYERANHQIQRTLRIRQDISLPNLSANQASQVTGSQAAADIARAAVSRPRPQPKGLRMRYRPPGSGIGQQGRIGSESESSDDDDQGSALQFPKTLGAFGTETRQDGDVEMLSAGLEQRQASVDKVSKKEKKKKKKHNAKEGQESLNGNHDMNMSKATKPPAATVLPNGVSPDPPKSHEEKARRKEEKQARKDEKRARKEERRKAKEAR